MDAGVIITGVLGVVGSVLTYFAGAKKEKANADKITAEVEGIRINNEKSAIEIWEDLTKTLKEELDGVKKQVQLLMQENKNLHAEVKILREENRNLHREVSRLTGVKNDS